MSNDDMSQLISKLDALEFVLSSAIVTPDQRSMSIAISLSIDIVCQLRRDVEGYTANKQ